MDIWFHLKNSDIEIQNIARWTKNQMNEIVKMDFFKRIGALASYLDDELHRIEAQYRIVLESGRRYENSADVVYEIREVSKNRNAISDFKI